MYFKFVRKIIFKRGHAHLTYNLLLLGNPLGEEIYPHSNRIQNSKWSNISYEQNILRNIEQRRNCRWVRIIHYVNISVLRKLCCISAITSYILTLDFFHEFLVWYKWKLNRCKIWYFSAINRNIEKQPKCYAYQYLPQVFYYILGTNLWSLPNVEVSVMLLDDPRIYVIGKKIHVTGCKVYAKKKNDFTCPGEF